VSVKNGVSYYIAGTGKDGIPDDHYHDVTVNLAGDQLSVFLDDSLLLNASSNSLLKTGNIGFGSDHHAMYFDDISIEGHGNPTAVESSAAIAGEFSLRQNYPNPFNPSSHIGFSLPAAEHVLLEVYNGLGQKVQTLIDRPMPAGSHEVLFSGEELASGIYFYTIQAGDFRDLRKMILLK